MVNIQDFKIIYEDDNLVVIDKPAGINADDIPMRIHRLDKETSGVLLVAKNEKSLKFLQKQFEEREVEKKYVALIVGKIKSSSGVIETLIGRSKKDWKKQKVYLPYEPEAKDKRMAITEYQVLQRFKDYTLVEVFPKTGRKHQIRVHFSFLKHPVAGDKLYGFREQPSPKELERHFLHASSIKIKTINNEKKEFKSELPEELKKIIKKLKTHDNKS